MKTSAQKKKKQINDEIQRIFELKDDLCNHNLRKIEERKRIDLLKMDEVRKELMELEFTWSHFLEDSKVDDQCRYSKDQFLNQLKTEFLTQTKSTQSKLAKDSQLTFAKTINLLDDVNDSH